jgi:hypothetical protein
MSDWETTIGATEADQVNKGEAFSRVLNYTDEAGDPRDITGATLEVSEAYPSSIVADMTLAITDGAGGVATVSMTSAQMANLGEGRVNWFRIKTTFASGAVDVTPKIWLQIT